MHPSDLVVQEFDPDRGHLGLFDRRTRAFYVISVAHTQVFNMEKLPHRPRGAGPKHPAPDPTPDQMTLPGQVEQPAPEINPGDFEASASAASLFDQ